MAEWIIDADIPNWTTVLGEAANAAQSGDVIVVSNPTRKALAERVLTRLGRTGITVEVRAQEEDPTNG